MTLLFQVQCFWLFVHIEEPHVALDILEVTRVGQDSLVAVIQPIKMALSTDGRLDAKMISVHYLSLQKYL